MLYVSKILLLANIVYVGAGWKKKVSFRWIIHAPIQCLQLISLFWIDKGGFQKSL